MVLHNRIIPQMMDTPVSCQCGLDGVWAPCVRPQNLGDILGIRDIAVCEEPNLGERIEF